MSYLDAIEIPDKTYFKIGEVAKLLDLEPYVLRYWESEFDVLDPDKTDSGQRAYQRDDIELICQIRHLLYSEMFTIAGARRQLDLEREGQPCYANGEKGVGGAVFDELELENSELREQVEELTEQLDAKEEEGAQPDMWEERLESQTERIEELEVQLAQARHTIAQLEEQRERYEANKPPAGLEPRLMSGLREQIEGLARLAQKRPV